MIRAHLKSATSDALQAIASDFERRIETSPRGCEHFFRDALLNSLAKEGEWKKEVSRNSLGHRKGRVDIVGNVGDFSIGLELKICEFPRTKNISNSKVLYDVGQLLWDRCGLEDEDFDYSYCIALIYTGGQYPDWTEMAAMRSFHNSLFCDLEQSVLFGELASQKDDPGRQRQISAAQAWGLDKPFSRQAADQFAFVSLHSRKLAVLGFPVSCGRSGTR